MLKLGLTGSIATGKTTVLNAIAALGVPTFSSDEAVHRLYDGGAAVAPVGAAFPGVVVDNRIDRSRLSAQLLAAPERLQELEAIVHPLVRAEIQRFVKDAEAGGAELAVVDIPLLYENGVDWGFDAVIVTAVDAAEQRRRALARPGMSVEKLDAILARQLPQAEKIRRADHVIDTSGPIAETEVAVEALIAKLQDEARTGR
jgi:dephospho-CoA kinase